MRINTKVVYDIESGDVLERESFEYPDDAPLETCNKAIAGAALIAAVIVLEVATAMFDPALTVNPMFQKAMFDMAEAGIAMEAGAIAAALASNRGMNITTRQAAASRQIIYGQQRVGGVEIFKSTTGSHKDQLNYVVVLSGHVCDSLVNIYLDGRQVHWAGGVGNVTRNGINFGGAADGNSHTGPNGQQYNFGGAVYCEARFGDQSEGEDPSTQIMASLRANDPTWDYDYNGNSPWVAGCTYLYLKVENNPGLFPGEPEIRVTVNGKNDIWDPRTQTYGFTTNWALISADIITDTQFGLGDNTVNQLNLIASANVCDEQIDLASGLTESRYSCNYHYDTGVAPGDALSAIMPAAAGGYSQVGGEHYLWPAYWQGPSFTFGAQHLTAPFQWKVKHSVPDLINRVNGTFVAPTFPYNIAGNAYDRNGYFNGEAQNNFSFAFQPTNFPQYAQDVLHGYPSDEWLAEDGGHQHPLELSLQSVLSVGQAQRLAKIALMRNRFQGMGMLEMSLAAYVMQPKSVFYFNFPYLNWTNKVLEVTGSTLSVAEDQDSGAQSVRVSFSVNETDSSIYEWSTIEELTVYDVPALPSQTPLTPAPPTNMVLNSGPDTAIIQPDGSLESVIQVSFNTPLDNLTVQIQVQYQQVGAGTWLSAPPIDIALNSGLISGVIAGQAYNVQIRSTRASGVSSEWVQQLNYEVSTTPSFLGTLGAQIPTIEANSALGGTVPGEMLANPNFVDGLTGWTVGSGSPAIDTTHHYLGTQSVVLQGAGLLQTVNLKAGHTYVLQGWVMTDGTVIAGGSQGAGVYVNDPSSQITVQKTNGTAKNLTNQNPGAVVATASAIPWTLVQLTFAVATSGAYIVALTDTYAGGAASSVHTWFDGISLTDTTGAADVTASQAIVYTGSSESIVPNGNFVLGNLQGWFLVEGSNQGFAYASNIPGLAINGGGEQGIGSPTFSVVPGQKYRINYDCWAGAGTQQTYLRINYAAANFVQITGANRSGNTDFIAAGTISTSEATYAYDWTCPAGVYYASLAVYAWGNTTATIYVKSVSCIPYGATGQWGADVTGENTAAYITGQGALATVSNLDGVPNGTEFNKPVLVNVDGTYHVSTPFLNQGGIIASLSVANFSATVNNASISCWNTTESIPYPNGSFLNIPASGSGSSPAFTFSGLSSSTTYYVSAYFTLSTGVVHMVMSDVAGGTQEPSYTQQMQTINADGNVGLIVGWAITTGATSTSSGGGTPPQQGCVEEGTEVVQPDGTIEELLPCNEWVNISVDGGKPLVMHPDTLVSVFKKASELTVDDRIEVQGANWQKFDTITHSSRPGTKVKRTCPGGVYHAGEKLVRLHNVKIIPVNN